MNNATTTNMREINYGGFNLPLAEKESRKNFIVKKKMPFVTPVKGRKMIFFQ